MHTSKKHLLTIVALLAIPNVSFADPETKNADQAKMGDMEMTPGSGMMKEGMLAIPQMDPARGRILFATKGCVVCHSVNSIGGEDAPAFDAKTMGPMMNPFEFAAKMWDGAEAMVAMQRDELGEPIKLSGQELADLIAFAHSHKEQDKFRHEDIPENIEKLMDHDK